MMSANMPYLKTLTHYNPPPPTPNDFIPEDHEAFAEFSYSIVFPLDPGHLLYHLPPATNFRTSSVRHKRLTHPTHMTLMHARRTIRHVRKARN